MGSGYGGTIKGQIYAHNKEFYARLVGLQKDEGATRQLCSGLSVDCHTYLVDVLLVLRIFSRSTVGTLEEPSRGSRV